MKFSNKSFNSNGTGKENPNLPANKRFKTCYIDGDTIIFRCAKFMQDDYVEVKHKTSGNTKEFRNKTSFGIRGDKIIPLKPEEIEADQNKELLGNPRVDKDGNPIKWLAWLNYDRSRKDQKTFELEDFEVEMKARLTSNHDSYEEALKASLDTAGFNIGAIKKFMDAEDYVFCLGAGEGNYRDYECKDVVYKGNRDGKPIYFEEFKEAFLAQYSKRVSFAVFNEAEDLLQHAAHQEEARVGDDFDKWKICITYIDKDVNMVYAPSFNYDNLDKGWRFPTKFECELGLAAQSISGDPTDHITGLPSLTDTTKNVFGLSGRAGASKQTAEKILEDSKTIQEMWERVIFCWQQYYGFDKRYQFKDVHGEEQDWTWIDYLQQCFVLVKMQDYQDVVPCVRKYLSKIGVDWTKEVKYGEVEVDTENLVKNLEVCKTTISSLENTVKSYKSMSKPLLVEKLDETGKLITELKGNFTLLEK